MLTKVLPTVANRRLTILPTVLPIVLPNRDRTTERIADRTTECTTDRTTERTTERTIGFTIPCTTDRTTDRTTERTADRTAVFSPVSIIERTWPAKRTAQQANVRANNRMSVLASYSTYSGGNHRPQDTMNGGSIMALSRPDSSLFLAKASRPRPSAAREPYVRVLLIYPPPLC